ncbi:MAG: GNAT family N-acetyltransferase [Fimbriimonadaceae bacterium]|nr:GNAT family N-acetyltransferase [Fimbriimonadaceae bacterium]
MIEIRQMQADDSFEELTHLLHTAYAELAEMGLSFTACVQCVETTRHRAAKGVCFLAFEKSTMIGTANLVTVFEDHDPREYREAGVAVLGQFGVAPSYRGRGVGRQLLQVCCDTALYQGFRRLLLDTAEPAEHLVRYYTKHWFRVVGTHQWLDKNYRSVIMAMPLAP